MISIACELILFNLIRTHARTHYIAYTLNLQCNCILTIKMRENGRKSTLEKYFEKVFSANKNAVKKSFEKKK